ncbi:MAG: hypothetical protein KBT02_07060 [Treponema sp.]|nr:hypothetical protein [Candidatus Treponema caballi]
MSSAEQFVEKSSKTTVASEGAPRGLGSSRAKYCLSAIYCESNLLPCYARSAEKSGRKRRKSLLSLNLEKALSAKAEESSRFLCTEAPDAFDERAEKSAFFCSFSAKWRESVLFQRRKL